MKTLTPAKARRNLTTLLSRAVKGEDIGIVFDGLVIALRPVEVFSEDYALVEYGLNAQEMARAEKNLSGEIAAERKAGKLKAWRPA